MAAYSGDVDSALIAKLLADATLMALVPDGIFYDIAKPGKTRFCIVKLMTHDVVWMFQGRAWETAQYLVKAVASGTSGTNVKAAGARIDALLDGGTLTVPGYSLMDMTLEEYVRYTEPDPANADARWQHFGGLYNVMVAPT